MMIIIVCLVFSAVTLTEATDSSKLPHSTNVQSNLYFNNNFFADKDLTVCYKGLGCFSTGGDFYSPTERPINLLPFSPKVINTSFILHTRSHDAEYLKCNDTRGIFNSNFDANKKTKFIIHGFIDNGLLPWVKRLAKELLTYGDYNVIAVNWAGGSGPSYTQATANTRVVGAVIAQFISYLRAEFHLAFENVHLIGHSLGAHVAGYAGERINKIARISGMDPAEPYYDGMPRSVRLDTTDAKFVDIIHTDDSSIIGIGYGTKQLSGHVDFFPNDGDNQPGCDIEGKVITFVLEGLKQGIRKTFACDHARSYELFTDSINSRCPYYGFQCQSWEDFTQGKCGDCGTNGEKCAQMGFPADSYIDIQTAPATKPFFLKTAAEVPYCLYNYQVVLHLYKHAKSEEQQGYLYITITGSKGKIQKIGLNSNLLKVTHPGTYDFLLTNAIDVGEIKDIEFDWDYVSTITSPSTWEVKKKLFGYGIKLFVENIKVNQMDITDSSVKEAFPSVFCGDKDKPVEENSPVTYYPKSYYSNQLCFENLGCFRKDGDFLSLLNRPINLLPEHPRIINVNFKLFTRENPSPGEILETSGQLTSFDVKKPTKLIVHGFTDSINSGWVKYMVNELLIHDDYNVIAVDWKSGASVMYPQAVANTRIVGAEIARLLQYLKSLGWISQVATSLATVLGATLQDMQENGWKTSHGSQARLDPAGPFFEGMPKSVCLDPSDAVFVDVIHTDTSSPVGVGLGMKKSIGDIDFYPNNGKDQKGCRYSSITFPGDSKTIGDRKHFLILTLSLDL
ncbi:Pancreatic triacylglycerol lipase [Nymphon striatum]|nr:Pancreatic triacylglycerol lipase [Nymphon striatum]